MPKQLHKCRENQCFLKKIPKKVHYTCRRKNSSIFQRVFCFFEKWTKINVQNLKNQNTL